MAGSTNFTVEEIDGSDLAAQARVPNEPVQAIEQAHQHVSATFANLKAWHEAALAARAEAEKRAKDLEEQTREIQSRLVLAESRVAEFEMIRRELKKLVS